MLEKGNEIKDLKKIQTDEASITTGTITTGNITTGNITTGEIATMNASNAKAVTKLVIPDTAYTGSAPAEVAIYATGGYLFVGDRAVWKSAALA